MTKLYKSFKVASKQSLADAVSIDGKDGFAHVIDLRPVAVVATASYSWLPGQSRTLQLVRVAGGEFGVMAQEAAAFPAHAQRLFSAEADARAAFAVMTSVYEADGSKWSRIDA